jgi:very-short-patch-repair endonuclease
MGYRNVQKLRRAVWELARRQHGVVARRQLLALGMHPQAIKHRVAKGKLFPLWPGVYAVGRPHVSQYGYWMAAVLTCGPVAVLSHRSSGLLWGLLTHPQSPGLERSRRMSIDVSVPVSSRPRRRGIRVHRRANLEAHDVGLCHGIPVTQPICTLVDLAARLPANQLEAAVNEADKLGLTDPEVLRAALEEMPHRRGARTLRKLLDRRTFTLTESELERRFLPIARRAGLSRPRTGARVNGFNVDFYWPELGLVVETDGLRYHRTPAQQARDRVRDQAHTRAGLTPLRFTHAQVTHEADYVVTTLVAVATRIQGEQARLVR